MSAAPPAITSGALVAAAAVTAGILVLAPGGDRDDKGGPSDPKPSATAALSAGAVGDVRTANPCALLDTTSLSRFGDTQLAPDYSELDRCDVLVLGGDGVELAGVEVNFSVRPGSSTAACPSGGPAMSGSRA